LRSAAGRRLRSTGGTTTFLSSSSSSFSLFMRVQLVCWGPLSAGGCHSFTCTFSIGSKVGFGPLVISDHEIELRLRILNPRVCRLGTDPFPLEKLR
jgi:hypothetical protein